MTSYEQARSICITMLSANTESISNELIATTIHRVQVLLPLTAEEQVSLQSELEVLYAVFSDKYRILDDQKPEPWVNNAKADIRWHFWNRYRMLLEQNGYAPDTINRLDNLTDDILDRLIRPGGIQPFDKRGLIVGHVQSGKTGNYTGLICKAADAGYKLIIVLAGIHNSLRSQTQMRIDEGFLGFDTQLSRSFTQSSNRIGVGKINPNLAAHSLTTNEIEGDFNRRASEQSGINIRGNDPIILVIKKNVSVMKNLLGWLAGRGDTMEDGRKLIKGLPLLVIDDEADNASINISKNYVSGINACIRSMLRLFEQSVYLGYTATPFANIFIKQYTADDVKGLDYNINNIPLAIGQDVFPRDFIVNIPAPSNYIGPEKIFGTGNPDEDNSDITPLKLYRIVDDYKELLAEGGNNENRPKPEALPPSLLKAIRCFFLSCAARRARGQETAHNSMLIHVTRFIEWQDRIASLVLDVVKNYARLVEFNDPVFLQELKTLWEEEYVEETRAVMANPMVKDASIQEIPWAHIEESLYPAVAKIEVRAVHGDTRVEKLEHKNIRPLDYYENRQVGLSVIAVGGNKLSRGLTLEGLTISYFLRASKMYDTLMQMGRWFGYRPGYLDLCRLFTSEELVRWYQYVTVATEEMRAEFDRMCDLGKTPAEFGLKVRTSPGGLVITAANKFRYKKIMELSFSGVLEETYVFVKGESQVHQENYDLTLSFLHQLGAPGKLLNSYPAFRNHFVWQGEGNADKVISYLTAFHTSQPSFNTTLISDYVEAQQKAGNVKNWTVALIHNTDDRQPELFGSFTVGRTFRSDTGAGARYYIISNSRLIDPKHEFIDLTDEQIAEAQKATVADAKNKGKDPDKVNKPSPLRIREKRAGENGLLLIYLLNQRPDETKPAIAERPLIGLAVSFPRIEQDIPIEYAVNEQFLKDLNYVENLDDDVADEPLAIVTEGEAENAEIVYAIWRDVGKKNQQGTYKVKPGVVVPYAKRSHDAKGKMLAVPEKGAQSVPFIRKVDIDRYYTNPAPDFWVINGGDKVVAKGQLMAPAVYEGQQFTMATENCITESDCITFYREEVAPEYLLFLLNSSLFAFYHRDKKGQLTEKLILDFPLILAAKDNPGIPVLVKCILFLQHDRLSREHRILYSYFMNALDAAAFEIYFESRFRERNLSVLGELASLAPFADSVEQAEGYYQMLNALKSPVRKAVFALDTIPECRIIYKTLSDEN